MPDFMTGQLRERHQPYRMRGIDCTRCRECRDVWPCAVTVLADAYDALAAGRAEQAHPDSSGSHTAPSESSPVQPGTEGEKRGSGDVSAAGTLTLPRDEWEAVKRVTALHAAAAERERICWLADSVGARYLNGGDWSTARRVSDLIREQS